MFYCVYAYSVDVVEVAPPGAAEDHRSCWDMQTQDHHFCCICVCSSCQSNSCETFFYNAPALNALPVHLLRQVFIFAVFSESCSVFVFCLSFWRSWGALWGPLGRFGSHLGACRGYLDDFFKSKNFGDKRAAIYHYRNANDIKEKIKKYNITIDIPSTYTTDYNSLVDDYVSTIYVEAMDLLEQENFSESEKLLKEVALLKPNFKDVNDLKNVATFEPIYRKANEFLELEKFRSAYYEYYKIPDSYQETKQRKLTTGWLVRCRCCRQT